MYVRMHHVYHWLNVWQDLYTFIYVFTYTYAHSLEEVNSFNLMITSSASHATRSLTREAFKLKIAMHYCLLRTYICTFSLIFLSG